MKTIYQLGMTLCFVLCFGSQVLGQCVNTAFCSTCVSGSAVNCSEDVGIQIDLIPSYLATPDKIIFTRNGLVESLVFPDFSYDLTNNIISFTLLGQSATNTIVIDSILQIGVDTCTEMAFTFDYDIVQPTIDMVTHTCNLDGTGDLEVTATASSGGDLLYSIGGSFQTGRTFASVPAGVTTVMVREDFGTGVFCEVTSDHNIDCVDMCPIVTAGADDEICADESYTLSGMITNGGMGFMWSGGMGSFDDASILDATYTPDPADGSSVMLTLSIPDPDGGGGCMESTSSMTLSINPLPVIAGDPMQEKCSGIDEVINIDVSMGTPGYTYSWTTSGGSFVDATIEDPIFIQNTPASNMLSVVVTDSKLCSETGVITVVTNALPAIPVPANDDVEICLGDPNQMLSVTLTGANVTADWRDQSNTTVATSTTTYTPTITNVDDYTYRVIARNTMTTCVSEDFAEISYEIRDLPNINNVTHICNTDGTGEVTILANEVAGGTLAYSIDGGAFQSQNTFSSVSPGTVSVIVRETVSGSTMCQFMQDYTFDCMSTCPIVSAGGDDEVCSGDTYQLSGTVTNNGMGFSWSTTGSGIINNPTSLDASYTPDAGETGDVELTLSIPDPDGGGGCMANMSTMTLTINSLPIIAGDPMQEKCSGTDLQINIDVTSGSGMYNYNWMTDGGSFVNNTVEDVIFIQNTTGSNMLSVLVTDSKTCTQTGNITVVTNSLPAAPTPVNSNVAICEGDANQALSVTVTGSNVTADWVDQNNNSVAMSTLSYTPTVVAVGTYTYRVVARHSMTGCIGPDLATITYVIRPRPSISNAQTTNTICSGEMTSGFVFTSPQSGTTYTWTSTSSGVSGHTETGSGNIPAETLTASSASSGTIDYTVVPALNTCPGVSRTFTVTVNPNPTVSLTVPAQICNNETPIQLTGSPASGMFSGMGVNGTGLFNPAQVSGGSSTITYAFTNANGCSDQDVGSIVVNTAPSVSISTFDDEVCLDEAPFSIPGSPAGSGGIYTSSNSGVSTSGLFTPSTAGVGTVNFTYTFTDGNGCVNDASGAVVVNSLPDASIGVMDDSGIADDETICKGDVVSLSAMPSGISYLWSGGQITNFTNGNVQVSPSDRTTYRVTVTDANGCTDISNESIDVNENPSSDFEIATAFNPIFFDQPFSLNNNSVISTDATLNSYTWCFSPSNVINLNGQDPTDVSLIDIQANNNNGTSSEAIDITLKIVDDNQCVDEFEASVNVVAMDCFAQTDFDPTEVHCLGEEIDINFTITVSTGAILTDIGARMTLGATAINLMAIPNTTNFRITDPRIIDTPGEWKFQLMFSDNNSQLCNDVVQEYTIRIEGNPNASFEDDTMINACRGSGPILIPLQINFSELNFSDDVEISYDIVQDGMLIRQLSESFNPQTTVLSIDDSDLTDVNAGVFEVVLTSIDNTDQDCPSRSLDSRKPIQLYDQVEYIVSDIQCEPDSTFSFNVSISGGSGMYVIENRIGVISATLVDPASNTYRYLCRLENYQILIEDELSGCLPAEINKEELPPPGCDCDFVYLDVDAGDITINNGLEVDNVFRICSDEEFDITISGAQFTLATDSLVLYVLNEGVTEDSILSRSIRDVATNIVDGSTFTTSLGGLESGIEYTLYAGVVQKSRDTETGLQRKDLTCKEFSNPIRVLFYQDPNPTALLDDTEFCANESNIILEASNLIESTEPGFQSSSIAWEVLDGNDPIGNTVDFNDPSKVSLHLSNSDPNSMYNLVLTEEVNYRGVTCVTSIITPITTESNTAPDTASIIYWPGNILVCTADTAEVDYQWGYIDHLNGDEDVNNIGRGKFLFLDQSLDVLSSTDRTYYVKLGDLGDDENRCTTIIYFTPTEGLDRDLTSGKNIIKVFPNPSDGHLIYQISGVNDGQYLFNVYDIHGRLVQNLKKYKEQFVNEIPLNLNVPPGLYMLQSISPNGLADVRKIMIH